MTMIENIMQQLQGLGLNTGGSFMDISQLGAGDISTALQGKYGLTAGQLPPSLFQPIAQGLLESTLTSSYAPQVEATGGNLISKMITNVQGQPGTQAYGGFAGSGQQKRFLDESKDVYGKGMVDVLTQTGQQRTQALQQVQDAINQWQKQATDIRFG
jgi:hypothetical protein